MDNGENIPSIENAVLNISFAGSDPVKLELLEARMQGHPLPGKDSSNNIHHHHSSNSQHSPNNHGTTTPTPSEEPMSDEVSAGGGMSIDQTDQEPAVVKDAKETKTPKHKARKRKIADESFSASKKDKDKDGKKIDDYFNRNHPKMEQIPRSGAIGLFHNPNSPESVTCCQSIQTELTGKHSKNLWRV